jgi:membrane protease YdiL (CAAX protease family)
MKILSGKHPTEPLPDQIATRPEREPSPHDRGALNQLTLVMAILLVTLAFSLYKGQDVYIFGYIIAVVIALSGPNRHHRPWSELGLKRGFGRDFRRVRYYFLTDTLLFQILPPTLGIAYVFGYYPEEIQHVTSRLSVNFGSLGGATAVGGLLAAALVLTLMEEVVFRVYIQERLSWFIGTPAAILLASVVFGLVHAVGTTGSLQVVSTDIAGVAIDGVFFGIIYAKTHNLALTWATHYTADVVGLLALVFVL